MATVIVTRTGKPASNCEVEAISTFGFRQHYQTRHTDSDGEAYFKDNANRFYIHVDGKRVLTVDALRGDIEIEL